MAAHLGDLLDAARRQRFVGRERELASFDAALSGQTPTRVLLVHGQGGIGKTTLLTEFRARAVVAGRPVVQLDGRDVDPSPEGMAVAAAAPPGAVLLVDGYEQLTPIDAWVRDDLIPGLGADTVVVLAGRDSPPSPWRTDPGWRQLVAVHRLDPFDPDECVRLLSDAGVADEDCTHLVRLGRGHPLAMAMLADLATSGTVPHTLADAPDLMSALLESFVRDAPSEAHLTGLATCVITWLTTEDLLDRLVGADAPAVWRWLAHRPFITSGPRGLTIHDLARDVLDTEFERRIPERYHRYHHTVQAHVIAGLRNATGFDRQVHAQRLLFLLRNSPLAEAFATLRSRGSASVVPGRPSEHDQVCEIVERLEGKAGADLARAWLSSQPENLSVVRVGDRVAGYAYQLFCPSGSPLEEQDPVVRACLSHVRQHGPARPGELVNIARFIGGAAEGQRDPYAVLAAGASSNVEWLTRPLAWTFCIFVDREYWAPLFDHAAFSPMFELDFGGKRQIAYGIDWRRLPIDTWLALMDERGHSGGSGPPPAALLSPPPLDRARFDTAVREALRTLHRPDQLGTNPLIGSALAATPAGPAVDQLRATLEAAVACLAKEPKGDQLRAVLDRTYLRPAATREAAAEVLDLPFSTYRRYLARALEQLTDLLWMVEIGDVHLVAPGAGD
ncbi:ATP-binding protein [Actinoplanes sp. TBRC 11911]|uniref:ATP-binding protein n=1 Tax=Actinoplanes sp. TBRC 11911 TaxID=2729386 RepID=UPI00145DBB41|nr:ATP-binding protein [Actinoplanes sp. TBRC 11911]NMO57577.1 ATP-binding protein [Actinoplanes sp. TBRC 11911]